jgi:predicted ATPase
MNPLKKIHIQGFKSIVDQAFEPGQVNVLIGANGSGKTALLEAIGMLSAAMNGRVDNSALQGRGVRLGTPQLYKSAFKGVEAQSIHLSFQWQDKPRNEKLEYSVTLENANQSPSAWYYQAESFRLNDTSIMQLSPSEESQESGMNNATQKASIHFGARHGIGFEAIYRRIENKRQQDFLEALKSYAIYSPTTPALRDLVTDITPLETDFPISFFGNRLAEAIEDIVDLEHEK